MKKIYLGVTLTVVGSLIVFGALLDQWDFSNNEQKAPDDIAIYQTMLAGMSEQMANVDPNSLMLTSDALAKQFSVELQLVPLSNIALPASFLSVLQKEQSLVLETDTKLLVYQTLKNHPNMLLQLTIPAKEKDNYFLDMMMTIALYSGIVLMLFFWLLPLTTRLHKLTELAAEFGSGKLSKRVKLSKFSYIDGLEKSFNQMATRIETLVADNKILAGSLSHDLRTPLACLRFGLEAALDTKNQEKQNTYLKRVDSDLSRLEDMLEAFLEYASLEKNSVNLVKRSINVNEIVLSVVNELRPLSSDCGIQILIELNINSETKIHVDSHWLYRALLNLLSNAMDYAKSRIVVDISTIENTKLVIGVHDDGEGIDDIDKKQIFTPLSKGDKSRNQDTPHYGLGLAIVSKVMEWHQGSVQAQESALLNGACFIIELPLD